MRPAGGASREIEVVRLFAAGLSVTEIGMQFNRSIKTISSHKMSALRKLGAKSDAALIEYARASGLAHIGLVHPGMDHGGQADEALAHDRPSDGGQRPNQCARTT